MSGTTPLAVSTTRIAASMQKRWFTTFLMYARFPGRSECENLKGFNKMLEQVNFKQRIVCVQM